MQRGCTTLSGKPPRNLSVKGALVCVILLAMPVRSLAAPHSSRRAQTSPLPANPQVRAALDWIAPNVNWVNDLLARAVHSAHVKPQRTILFVADVGEEGEGNLRGMRALVEAYRSRLKAVVVLDGSGTDHVTTKALASRRLEALITGP